MKKNILIVTCSIFAFLNCSVNNDRSINSDNVKYLWHLINVSGGIAGIDEQFELGTIVWEFNEDTSTLTVTNNNENSNVENGLDTGTYEFSVLNVDNKTYLVINSNEIGSFEISQNILTINQNEMSNGTGADGFIYTFQVEIITI